MKMHLRNLFYILIVQCGNYIFPIITIPIVARALGPSLIGTYSLITAITAYFTLVVTYSFNYTGVRRLSHSPEKASQIFNVIFFSKLVLCIFTFVIFIFLLDLYPVLSENSLASWLCFISVVSCVFQNNWIFQFNGDFKFITFISVVTKVISSILIIIFINNKSDFLLYVLFVQLALLLNGIFGFLLSLIKYKISFNIPRIQDVKLFLFADSYIFISGVLANLYTTSSIVLLGYFCSSQEVGYYSSAQKIIDLIKNFSVLPLNMLIFPIISRRFSVSKESGVLMFRQFMPYFFGLAFVSTIFIYLFGGFIISVFFGHEFHDSIKLIKILSLGYFSVFFGVVIGGQVVLGLGLDKQFVIMQSLVAIFSLACNFILLPRGGAEATAWVWSLSELMMLILQLLILKFYKVKILDYSSFKPSEVFATLKRILVKH